MTDQFRLQPHFLVGKPTKGKWSGVFVSPSDDGYSEKFGNISLLIGLSAPDEFDSTRAGDLLLENLQDVYFDEKNSRNIIGNIEKAILSTAKRLEHLLEREEVASEKGIDLQIIAIVIKDDLVYMAVLGEGSILLNRAKNIIDLTQGLKDLSGRDLIRSGSGRVQLDDTFVLVSPSASMAISEKELQQTIKSAQLNVLTGKESDPLFGVLLVKLSSEERVDEEEFTEATKNSKAEKADEGFSQEAEDESEADEPLYEEKFDEEEEKEDKSKVQVVENTEKQSTDHGAKPTVTEIKQKLGDKVQSMKKKFGDNMRDKKTYQVLLLRLRDYLVQGYGLVKKYVWEGLLGMGGEGIYIKGSGPRKPIRGIIILILVVISLLYLSFRTYNRHQEKSTNESDVRLVFEQVDEKYHNGKNLGEAGSISDAVALIEEALKQLEDAKSFGVLEDEIDQKINEGVSMLDQIQKVIVITDENILTDAAAYIEGVEANDIVLYDGKIYIADKPTGAIYSVSTNGGEVGKVTGESTVLSEPESLTIDNEGNFLVFDVQAGIVKYNPVDNSINELVGLSASSVGGVTQIENYTTPDKIDFLYLLRAGNNDVRKISKYPSGYSLPALRLANSQFSTAKDIAIDGKIYILTGTGEGVIRYYVDTQDPFRIIGLDKPINGSTSFELDDRLIFLGDSANKRVVITTKGSSAAPQQGKYVAQIDYRGEGDHLSSIKEIVVDKASRVMYILDGTKIFKVELFDVDKYAEDLL